LTFSQKLISDLASAAGGLESWRDAAAVAPGTCSVDAVVAADAGRGLGDADDDELVDERLAADGVGEAFVGAEAAGEVTLTLRDDCFVAVGDALVEAPEEVGLEACGDFVVGGLCVAAFSVGERAGDDAFAVAGEGDAEANTEGEGAGTSASLPVESTGVRSDDLAVGATIAASSLTTGVGSTTVTTSATGVGSTTGAISATVTTSATGVGSTTGAVSTTDGAGVASVQEASCTGEVGSEFDAENRSSLGSRSGVAHEVSYDVSVSDEALNVSDGTELGLGDCSIDGSLNS
jgi:hypothetical protein